MKLKSKDKDLEALKSLKEDLTCKVSQMDEKALGYKKQIIVLEKKLAEYESDKDFMFLKSKVKNLCNFSRGAQESQLQRSTSLKRWKAN